MKLPKIKVTEGNSPKELSELKAIGLRKLKAFKEQGGTKEKACTKFTKVFVDKNYDLV